MIFLFFVDREILYVKIQAQMFDMNVEEENASRQLLLNL